MNGWTGVFFIRKIRVWRCNVSIFLVREKKKLEAEIGKMPC